VYLVGFTIEIYYDARSYKRQIVQRITLNDSFSYTLRKNHSVTSSIF